MKPVFKTNREIRAAGVVGIATHSNEYIELNVCIKTSFSYSLDLGCF